jgi:ribosomal protein S18 acetylase RimI-like enzyme
MSKVSSPPNLRLRGILLRDLPYLVQIEQKPAALRWTPHEMRAVLQSANTAGWVIELGGRVVGFLIYVAGVQPEPVDTRPSDEPRAQPHWAKGSLSRKPLHITLLNFAVAADWQRCGLGRVLLEKLNQELRQLQDRIQAIVPESNLAAQLLLRSGGYKAVRVLRGYYGDEDGYLMERRRD